MFGLFKKKKRALQIGAPVQAIVDSVRDEPDRWKYTRNYAPHGNTPFMTYRERRLMDTRSGFSFWETVRIDGLDRERGNGYLVHNRKGMALTPDEDEALLRVLREKEAEYQQKEEIHRKERARRDKAARLEANRKAREELGEYFQ